MDKRPDQHGAPHGRAEHDMVGAVLNASNPHIGDDANSPGRPWAGIIGQVVLITAACLLYFGVRMVTKDAESAAFRNAERVLDLERFLRIDIESWAQDQIIGSDATVTFFNWIYIWLHWPVIIVALLWLYRNRRRGFVLLRNGLIVSGAIGLVFFVLLPMAPPRFLDGYVDTVADLSTSYKYLQPPSIVNKFAAMPSLHVGWNLLVAIVLYRVLVPPAKYLVLLSPVLMIISVVVTGNHYILDAVAGAAIVIVALPIAERLIGWTEDQSTEHEHVLSDIAK